MPLLPPSGDPRRVPHARPRATPALYATPEFTPLPETSAPSSFPPSPYVINHKRRGPRLLKSFSQSDVKAADSTAAAAAEPIATSKSFSEGDVVAAVVENGGAEVVENRGAKVEEKVEEEGRGLGEGEDFFDPRESMSVASSAGNAEEDAADGSRWKGGGASAVEYYDAFEEISSEGVVQSAVRNMEAELHEMRLNLLMEIDKRKQAEDTLLNLKNYWQILRNQLSLVGIRLPDLSSIMEDRTEDLCFDSTEDLQQQVILARLVAGSIGRGSARAEVEMETESQIEAKNFEIARLSDRLHYYEAANREMSQRNQEAVERARRQRQRQKRRWRWVWGSVGLAIATGAAAAAAWSHYHVRNLPTPSESSGSDLQQHN